MRQLRFTKMHGLGNDFVVVNDLEGDTSPVNPALARRICDRRFGIGADQVLWLKRPIDSSADARMEILNPDGSSAEMCGNGIRAVTLELFRKSSKKAGKTSYVIETLAGLKHVEVRGEGRSVRVDMGRPVLYAEPAGDGELLRLPSTFVDAESIRFFEVNVGNPHAVIFVEDVARFLVEQHGPLIEHHPRFPKRTNVEFVQVLGSGCLRVRVWERGTGITLACGTGACAAVVAALATNRVAGPVTVELPGGSLRVEWGGPGHSVFLEGPAEETFRGEFPL